MLERSAGAGYVHYEISNLCLPGFESCHNKKYWTGAPYYGFGCSAHSYDGSLRRWANERDVKRFVELVEAGDSPVGDHWILSENDRRAETIFLGLRLMNGINLAACQKQFGLDLPAMYAREIEDLTSAGLIELKGNMLKLTTKGSLLSNEVFSVFV
jgi:oxygen-independent coproporphyrinogen-3 oxidase